MTGFLKHVDPIPSSIIDSRIVFVCKGNICRSALAHCYLNLLGYKNVSSFGLDTHPNKPAYKELVRSSAKEGVDLTIHRTSCISTYSPRSTDLIICMEPYQSKMIKRRYPNIKVTLLGLFLEKPIPYIHDPYGCSEPYLKKCTTTVMEAIKKMTLKLTLT